MDKIRITKVAKEVNTCKGFDERTCYGTPCDDACCIGGCDIDKESHDLIIKHKGSIGKTLAITPKKFFKGKWSGDPDYLGGNSVESNENKTGQCIFHLPKGKGCALYKLVTEKNLPRRVIPTICRIYPLNWNRGVLYFEKDLEKTCNCACNKSDKNILETQKEEIEDIFEISLQE
ncbi:MAG: hypothetical protein ABIH63_02670 [archaeon]